MGMFVYGSCESGWQHSVLSSELWDHYYQVQAVVECRSWEIYLGVA